VLDEAHHKRLAGVIEKTGRFLDPIIAVTAPDGGFWTPNGRHRLAAMKRLGAKSITALVLPNRELAWQILALNTEKAHSLEVIRIYRGLVEENPTHPESQFAFYLEEPALITLGCATSANHVSLEDLSPRTPAPGRILRRAIGIRIRSRIVGDTPGSAYQSRSDRARGRPSSPPKPARRNRPALPATLDGLRAPDRTKRKIKRGAELGHKSMGENAYIDLRRGVVSGVLLAKSNLEE
jgi:hypothetical protein